MPLSIHFKVFGSRLLTVMLIIWGCSPSRTNEETERPNILLIVVDDLGYADLGCYGSEIETKNIDALASEGIRFTNFYASPNCSPTRSMLLSGMDNHQAGIGAMAGLAGSNQKGKPGYEGYLNDRTLAFSELLKDTGYRTYYTGKWHLGTNKTANPNARGFDKAWWQVGGSPGSHFDWSPPNSRRKHNYFENAGPQTYAHDNLFSTKFFSDKLIAYLEEGKGKNTPFLGVLSFSAVHIPIQCPETHIDLYKGRYKQGYEALRKSRLQRQKELGIVGKEVGLSNMPPNSIPWKDLLPEEQLYYARRMEVYAGMVDNMDDNVGKLIEYLKKSEQYENTMIFVMSDNGGAGFNGWQSKEGIRKYEAADNSFENLGRKGSLNYIGSGWGSAVSTPFRLFKRHITEGGLRIPMIIGGGYLKSENFKNGIINHEIFTVRDIAPTIQEVVGVAYPQDNYKDRNLLPQTGKSFVSLLENDPTQAVHSEDEIFGWELFKRRAVQKNGWKIVWTEPDFGKGSWELYNLRADPIELNDLASSQPEKLTELIHAWNQYRLENNVIISDGPIAFP